MTDMTDPKREAHTAAFQNTDDADPALVLAAVRHCALSWEGEARLLGNVRAKDIVRAIEALTASALGESTRWLMTWPDGSETLYPIGWVPPEVLPHTDCRLERLYLGVTPVTEVSYTSPPPAPGIKEAFELFNGIVGSPDANGLVTVKINEDCLARIHNIAAAPPRPDDGGGVRDQIAALAHRFWSIHPSVIAAKNLTREEFYTREMTALFAALSKPSDAPNASAEARLPNWGQIVQILLRCMDATIKNETSREQAERMANELLEKYPALSAVGGEAKKSEGGAKFIEGYIAGQYAAGAKPPVGPSDRTAESSAQYRKAVDDANRMNDKGEVPSDPTADVTVEELAAIINNHIEHGYAKATDLHPKIFGIDDAARALLDAFTVGRR